MFETLRALWVGRAIGLIVVLFFVADGLGGLFNPAGIAREMAETGYTADKLPAISLLALLCALVYAIPQTALLGAILITGFVGGAIATHVRVSGGIIAPEMLCAAVALLAWLGLYLRDSRLRAMLPIRR